MRSVLSLLSLTVWISTSCDEGRLHREHYGSGVLKSSVRMVDGKREGRYLHYYESGGLLFDYHYRDGRLEGRALGYYEDGALRFEKRYEGGVQHGLTRHYHRNGADMAWENWKGGRLEGPTTTWYEDGGVEVRVDYRDGLREGRSVCYRRDGTRACDIPYRGGKAHGEAVYYDEKGMTDYVRVMYGGLEGEFMDYEGGILDEGNSYFYEMESDADTVDLGGEYCFSVELRGGRVERDSFYIIRGDFDEFWELADSTTYSFTRYKGDRCRECVTSTKKGRNILRGEISYINRDTKPEASGGGTVLRSMFFEREFHVRDTVGLH